MPTDIIITPGSGEIEFHNTQGTVCGKISTSGNNLVFANEAGDVLIGDGSSDIYVGDGVNNVDIVFEQDGEIRGEVGSAVTLTLGSNDTTVYVTGSTLAFQKDGGNVGIGTTTPSRPLSVQGVIGADKTDGVEMLNLNPTATGGVLTLKDASGNSDIFLDARPNNNSWINNGGSFGIGTTSPGEKLHVYQGNIEIEAAAASAQGLIFSENGTQTMGIKYQGGQSGNPIDIFRYQDNTTKVRFTEAGYVGIGTTSPGYKLDVDGDINLQLGDNIRFGSQLAIKKESNGELQLYGGTNSSDGGFVFNTWNGSAYEASATINNSKRLGVGTTSPNNELEILGSNSPRISLRTSNEAVSEALELGFQVGTGANASSNSVGLIKSVITQATPSALIGDMEFQTNSGDSISTKMIIKGDGKVGIGITTPNAKLDVNSGASGNVASFKSGATNSGNYAGITLHTTTNSGDDWYGSELRSINTAGTPGSLNPRLGFFTQNNNTYLPADRTEKMSILGNGNVGIGTTSPSTELEVNGEIKSDKDANGVSFSATGGPSTFTAYDVYTATNGGLLRLYDASNQTVNIDGRSSSGVSYINNGGNFGIGTTSPGETLEVAGNIRLGNGAARDIIGPTNENLRILANPNSSTEGIIFSTDGGSTTEMFIQDGGNVGINMTSPISSLHIGDGNDTIDSALYSTDILNVSAQNTAPGFNIISAGSSAYNRGVFKATRSRGTLASPTATGLNDYVFSLLGVAYDGTAGRATAGVEMRVDGNVSSGNAPQRIEFQTGTTTSRSTRMTIKSSGNVGIGTTSPGTKLDVNGDTTTDNLYLASNIIHEGDTNTSFQFSTDTIRLNTAGNTRLTLSSTGTVTLGAYGSGTQTGTQTVNLEADSSGNIIERLEERGTFSISTNGTGDGSFSHSLGETPTIVMLTADTVGSATVTVNVSSKTSTTINVKSSQRNATVTGYYIISS